MTNTTRLSDDTIADLMLAHAPELDDAYKLSVYAGELMVTIFLGNAAQHVLEQARRLASSARTERAAIDERIAATLGIVERGLVEGDDKLSGAISAAFIEGLDTNDAKAFRTVVERLGPRSRDEVKVLTKFYHSKEWLDFLDRDK